MDGDWPVGVFHCDVINETLHGRGRVGGAVGWRINGGKEKGMVHLTERRAWRTRQGHTAGYRGKHGLKSVIF